MAASRSVLVATLAMLSGAIHLNGPARGQDHAAEARLIAELEKRLTDRDPAKPGQPRLGTPTALPLPSEKKDEHAPAMGDLASPPNESGPFGLTPAWTAFKDGFVLHSIDQRHQVRITGQLQADYRIYPNPGDSADIDAFLVRRARLGIEANLFDHYEFRLVPDWGNNRSVIQDAYLNIHHLDEVQLQIGKFRPPVGYERLIRARFMPTYERSMLDQLIPARDMGVMLHGKDLLGGRIDYALAVMNGEIASDQDSNKLRDLLGRVAVTPFHGNGFPECLQQLQVGISGSTGKQETAMAPNPLRTPGSIPWLTFASTVRADGPRTRWMPEMTYFYRSLGLTAQYLHMNQEMRSNATAPVVNIPFDGYYFLATYLITGEQRTAYNQLITPLRPFDVRHPLAAPGAWELVARFSHLQLGEQIFLPGNLNLANPKNSSAGASELTLGFNWYLNSLVRLQANWEHAWYRSPINLGANASFRQTNAVLVRVQIIF